MTRNLGPRRVANTPKKRLSSKGPASKGPGTKGLASKGPARSAPSLTQLPTAWSMRDAVYWNAQHPNLMDCCSDDS
jgi:hypothetical protein